MLNATHYTIYCLLMPCLHPVPAKAYMSGTTASPPETRSGTPKSKSTGITINISVSPQGRLRYISTARSGCGQHPYCTHVSTEMLANVIVCSFTELLEQGLDLNMFMTLINYGNTFLSNVFMQINGFYNHLCQKAKIIIKLSLRKHAMVK